MTDTLPSDWIDRVRTAERSGDFLVSYDIATQGLAEHPDSVDLRYLATRVLARSGADLRRRREGAPGLASSRTVPEREFRRGRVDAQAASARMSRNPDESRHPRSAASAGSPALLRPGACRSCLASFAGSHARA